MGAGSVDRTRHSTWPRESSTRKKCSRATSPVQWGCRRLRESVAFSSSRIMSNSSLRLVTTTKASDRALLTALVCICDSISCVQGFTEENVYLCESRYSYKLRNFKKIKVPFFFFLVIELCSVWLWFLLALLLFAHVNTPVVLYLVLWKLVQCRTLCCPGNHHVSVACQVVHLWLYICVCVCGWVMLWQL